MKLLIHQKDEGMFQKLFKFWLQNDCELLLVPEGIKYRGDLCQGIVKSGAFALYPVKHKKKLGRMSGTIKDLRVFFKKWEKKDCVEYKAENINGIENTFYADVIEIPIG